MESLTIVGWSEFEDKPLVPSGVQLLWDHRSSMWMQGQICYRTLILLSSMEAKESVNKDLLLFQGSLGCKE